MSRLRVVHPFLSGVQAGPAVPAGSNGHGEPPPDRGEDITVGDTPWIVVAALAACFTALGALLAWSLRRAQ